MPAWSDEIAGFLVREAGERQLLLDQLQLQALVYIAHGWRLATSGEPLTGDRPIITPFGPDYERISRALRSCGLHAVRRCDLSAVEPSVLDQEEVELISSILAAYGSLNASQLGTITRDENSPWCNRVGAGSGQEIGHHEVRRQFEAYRNHKGDNAGAEMA